MAFRNDEFEVLRTTADVAISCLNSKYTIKYPVSNPILPNAPCA